MNYQDLFSNREFTNAKKELCDVEDPDLAGLKTLALRDPGQLSDLYHSRFNCADSFFNIGQDHLKSASPCQDYTISDRFGVLPYGIVSDGCSSSGKTDLGSRFVVLSTQKIIHEGFCPFFLKDIDNLRDSLVEKLYRIKREYRLTDFDLDATLGLVMSVPRFETFMKKEIYVAKAYMFGDGVLSYQCDDTLTILSLHWAGNMPGYPSYYLDRSRRDIFVKIVEENAKLENIAPCFIKKTILQKNTSQPNGYDIISISTLQEMSAEEGLKGFFTIIPENAHLVMMASDGVLQVNGVDYQDVLWGLSSLKSSRQGHFFQRRFNKMMSGWGVSQSLPRDDISAVILTSGQEE